MICRKAGITTLIWIHCPRTLICCWKWISRQSLCVHCTVHVSCETKTKTTWNFWFISFVTSILHSKQCFLSFPKYYDYILISFIMVAEKLEWGNSYQINQILQKYSGGFDLVLGADIYIHKCFFSSSSFLRNTNMLTFLQLLIVGKSA